MNEVGDFECFDTLFFYSQIQCASSLSLEERKGKDCINNKIDIMFSVLFSSL